MEAGQHDIRIRALEEGNHRHEATHGRMWDRINQQEVDHAVHKQKTDDGIEQLVRAMHDVASKQVTNARLLTSTLVTGLLVFIGLVANLILMLADKTP